MTSRKKAGVALVIIFVAMSMWVYYLWTTVPGQSREQLYGMLITKKIGDTIYFPDACAIKSGEGKYASLTFIADKNGVVYASVKNSECVGFYVCKNVPVPDKQFKFQIVTEAECKMEGQRERSKN